MVRTIFITITLLLLHSTAYACSCGSSGVIPISYMLGDYDFVFMARVDDAIDQNNNHWPSDWHEDIDFEEYKTLARKITPTKSAKITTIEVFKGSLEGSLELNFKTGFAAGNCAGGYYYQGERTLFFLNDLEDGFVRPADICSSKNQYIYSIEQIREFAKNGTNPDLLSSDCKRKFYNAARDAVAAELFGLKYNDKHSITSECAPHYEDYKAGKFTISQAPEP